MVEDGKHCEVLQRIQRLTDTAEKPSDFFLPISGYERQPLVSLEEAVAPLLEILPAVQSYTYAAKQRCKNPDENLTRDEQAAIMLYSIGWEPLEECLYYVLNAKLRSKDRGELKPWFLYLRLFLGALFRLPAEPRCTVYRGIRLHLAPEFEMGGTVVWWGFTSCTTSICVLQSDEFLGKTGPRTMFMIDCFSARNISKYSFYPSEDEKLLLAASHFKVKSILDQGHGLHTIQLEETKPPVALLFPVSLSGSKTDVLMKSSSEFVYKDKRFLIIGPTGVGKSTVVNVLYNGNARKESLTEPADARPTAEGVTKTLNTYFDRNKNAYTDTIGFADRTLKQEQWFELIKKLIDGTRYGYNRIYLCLKYGRFSEETRKYIDLIITIFGETGLAWSTIIFTHCTKRTMDIGKYRDENNEDEIIKIIDMMHGAIFGSFQTNDDEEEMETLLEKSRMSFLGQIQRDAAESSDYYYIPKPSNPDDWLQSIIKFLENRFQLRINSEYIDHIQHYGTCSYCSKNMSNTDNTYFLCGHVFHKSCISKSLHQKGVCPTCNQESAKQQEQDTFPSRITIRRRDQ
ncbi:unnamed protein product [Rotaria magnacalcarata]|uniref:NAD(P)(+)--arginine ADP-ribosyltransferase n=1 Tax=Rotaria magnacalcarata TaxID=392030 RepID=A0A816TUR0_9BILA|nr:unnamed protein product [Rotaria magnacalcarata]